MIDSSPIPDRAALQAAMARLSKIGVRLGTSSWKYAGWLGQLYDEARYVYRGRFSEARFQRLCLSEYAEVFKTVGVDAAYYQFPTAELIRQWMEAVPDDFQFSFKVTDDITLRHFPNFPRFGARAGQPNPEFLNASLFASRFLAPLEPFASKVGVVMFEFTRFRTSDFSRGRDFLDALDRFFSEIPRGWRYGVEIRNANFFRPEYLELLRKHQVAHILNSWDAMPPFEDQLATPGVVTTEDFVAGRLLLRPGRAYAEAVEKFSPYQRIQDPYPAVRSAAAQLVRQVATEGKPKKAFLYVNNRLEGSALGTLQAILQEAGV